MDVQYLDVNGGCWATAHGLARDWGTVEPEPSPSGTTRAWVL